MSDISRESSLRGSLDDTNRTENSILGGSPDKAAKQLDKKMKEFGGEEAKNWEEPKENRGPLPMAGAFDPKKKSKKKGKKSKSPSRSPNKTDQAEGSLPGQMFWGAN